MISSFVNVCGSVNYRCRVVVSRFFHFLVFLARGGNTWVGGWLVRHLHSRFIKSQHLNGSERRKEMSEPFT